MLDIEDVSEEVLSISISGTDEATELIPKQELKVKDFFLKGIGVDKMLKDIREKTFEQGQDVSTEEGRENVRSNAYKLTRSKTFLDKLGKDVVSAEKKKVDAANKNRKKIRETIDKDRDDYRKPLTDWEAQEKIREEEEAKKEKKKIEDRIEMLTAINVTLPFASVSTMADDVFEILYDSEKMKYESKIKADEEAEVKRKADEAALEEQRKDLEERLKALEEREKKVEDKEQVLEEKEKELNKSFEDETPDEAKEDDTPPDDEAPPLTEEFPAELQPEEIDAQAEEFKSKPMTNDINDINDIKVILNWVDQIKTIGLDAAPPVELIVHPDAKQLFDDITGILEMFDTNIRIRIKEVDDIIRG